MHKVNVSRPLIFFLITFIYYPAFADINNDIIIHDAWISEAPPTVSVLAAYARIQNTSSEPLSLISASSPTFSSIEIHRSVIKNDMVSMEKQKALMIPAEGTAELTPGDYHLMLFNPKKPLRAGDETEITLVFDNGQSTSLKITVERRKSDDHSHHHHHH